MYLTEKRQPWIMSVNIFGVSKLKDGNPVEHTLIYTNHNGRKFLMVNPEIIELTPEYDRVEFINNKSFIRPSAINVVKSGMSFAAYKCAEEFNDELWMQNFIEIDASTEHGSDLHYKYKDKKDLEKYNKEKRDALCAGGLLVPLAPLKAIGLRPAGTLVNISVNGANKLEKYIVYQVAIQSASKNRLCRATMSSLPFGELTAMLSCNAKYLHEAYQPIFKSISRESLACTNGTIVKGFMNTCTYAVVDDLEIVKEFKGKMYYDSDDIIKERVPQEVIDDIMADGTEEEKEDLKSRIFTRTMKKAVSANDGMGFILPSAAKKLAKSLGVKRVPSMFQVRWGQVKGILVVFDYRSYTKNVVTEDIILTGGMWKADFDPSMAEFLVGNISKPYTDYVEWNYQMITTLNNQLGPAHFTPYLERIKHLVASCTDSVENALAFLKIVPYNYTDENTNEIIEDTEEKVSTDKLREFILANPDKALTERWVNRGILRRKESVQRNMLGGHVPMPGSIHIMASDPIAFFNKLNVKRYIGPTSKVTHKYTFDEQDKPVITYIDREKELQHGNFYLNGYEGDALAMRTPLTHWAQIRKLNCVKPNFKRVNKDGNVIDWYSFMSDLVIFNVYDETVLGMGGADFDGDFCFVTKIFIDEFKAADYIIYNDNPAAKGKPEILNYSGFAKQIHKNLIKSRVGLIINENTKVLCILNDEKAYESIFQSYSRKRFERLNIIATTMSELEIDKPKSGYSPNFGPEHRNNVTSSWFAAIRPNTVNKETIVVETNDIMGYIHKFVNEQIVSIEPDYTRCFDSIEAFKQSEYVNIEEAKRVYKDVAALESEYATKIRAIFSSETFSKEEQMNMRKEVIRQYTEKLNALSDDIYSLAFAAYTAGELRLKKKGKGSKSANSFVFMCAFEGIRKIAESVSKTNYKIFNLYGIPSDTKRIIVYNGKYRAEGIGQPFVNEINLADGTYEVNNAMDGRMKIILPFVTKGKNLNNGEFRIKVSWKTSELDIDSKYAYYAIDRMQSENSVTTIVPTTMDGNLKYVLMVNGEWLGTIMNDKNASNMDDIAGLAGKELKYVETPVIGNGNTLDYKKDGVTVYRTANIMTFINTGKDTGHGVMAETAGDIILGGSFIADDYDSNWYATDEDNYEDMAADMGYTVALTQEEIDGLEDGCVEDLSAYDF